MEVRGGGLEALGGEVLLWQALCREHQPCQHQVDLNIGNIENVTYVNTEPIAQKTRIIQNVMKVSAKKF